MMDVLQPLRSAAYEFQKATAFDASAPGLHTVELDMSAYILQLAFAALDYEECDAGEKTRWAFAMRFRGEVLVLRHGKFALRAIFPGALPAESFLTQLVYKLKGIQRQMAAIAQPVIDKAVQEGRVTIRSRSHLLRRRYEYFRTQATAQPQPAATGSGPSGLAELFNAHQNANEAAFYNLHAMLDAYFTWTEHLLLLALPFQSSLQMTAKAFVTMTWTKKIRAYFGTGPDAAFQAALTDVIQVKENYRNAVTHGFVSRDDATYFVHIPAYGAIPINLAALDDPSNQWLPLHIGNMEEILHKIDTFDALFKAYLKLPLLYLNEVMYVHYDPASSARYQGAMASEEAMTHLAYTDGAAEDRQINVED